MKTAKIFTACAIGAFIGSLMALEFQPLWRWFGLVVGGFIGYLAYEPMAVLLAGKKAIRVVWEARKWRIMESQERRRMFRLGFKAGVVFGLDVLLLFLILDYLVGKPILRVVSSLVIVLGIGLLCGWAVLPGKRETAEQITERVNDIKYFTAAINPAKILFYWIPKGVGKGICFFPILVRELGLLSARFFKTLFLLIHSDIRLLCGADAAIGALVGLKTGSPIVGAIAGGLVGVINYQLVTVRLLKPYLKKIKT